MRFQKPLVIFFIAFQKVERTWLDVQNGFSPSEPTNYHSDLLNAAKIGLFAKTFLGALQIGSSSHILDHTIHRRCKQWTHFFQYVNIISLILGMQFHILQVFEDIIIPKQDHLYCSAKQRKITYKTFQRQTILCLLDFFHLEGAKQFHSATENHLCNHHSILLVHEIQNTYVTFILVN